MFLSACEIKASRNRADSRCFARASDARKANSMASRARTKPNLQKNAIVCPLQRQDPNLDRAAGRNWQCRESESGFAEELSSKFGDFVMLPIVIRFDVFAEIFRVCSHPIEPDQIVQHAHWRNRCRKMLRPGSGNELPEFLQYRSVPGRRWSATAGEGGWNRAAASSDRRRSVRGAIRCRSSVHGQVHRPIAI
jgi:hypothetical protein